MTPPPDPPPVRPSPPPPAVAPAPGADAAARARALNRTHAMSALRARGGRVVRAIEERRRRLVSSRVLRGAHRVVVDLGAEDGWMSEAWAGAAEQAVLVDVDPEVLAAAAHRALPPRVRTAVADATDVLALERACGPGSADVVVLSALLEHLPDPGRALAAATRLLRPGGRIVVYVPADGPILALKRALRWSGLGGLFRGLPLDPAPGHLRTWRRADLRRLLGPRGRVREVTFDPRVLGWVAVLDPRPAPRPGGA